jgi:hypothetical protein
MRNERMTGSRGGFALPIAVFALVVVGVLVTGGFYMARQETRIGIAGANAQAAFYLAERGIYNTLANWQGSYASVAAWSTTTATGSDTDGTWSVSVMPMTSKLFFLRSTGTVTAGGPMMSGATRQVGMIARVQTPNMEPNAALTTVGTLNFGGNAIIDGRDNDPTGWVDPNGNTLCPDDPVNKPGILMNDTTNLDFNGNEANIRTNQLNGSVDIAQKSTMTTDSLLWFGDLHFDDLKQLATKRYTSEPASPAPVLNGAVCNTDAAVNWGEPLDRTHACFNFFPIIYFNNPNLTWNMSGGRGQGILLVEGSLKITGQFEFYGPVIIKGTLSTQGGGGTQHFHGGVVAANALIEDNTVLGTADIVFSKCAVQRAVLNNSSLTKARPLARRSWVDVSSITY